MLRFAHSARARAMSFICQEQGWTIDIIDASSRRLEKPALNYF